MGIPLKQVSFLSSWNAISEGEVVARKGGDAKLD